MSVLNKNSMLPICQRCYHQAICATQIFVLIGKGNICHRYPSFIQILFEVETTLFQPLKIIG